jgi:hypothetical protein
LKGCDWSSQGFEATLDHMLDAERTKYHTQIAGKTKLTSVYRPYFDPICDFVTPVPEEVNRVGRQNK